MAVAIKQKKNWHTAVVGCRLESKLGGEADGKIVQGWETKEA